MSESRQTHWDRVYATKATTGVSWYERSPARSLDLIRATGVALSDPIIDIGGGASFLVDELLAAGHTDVTVLDVSAEVLAKVRERLGAKRVTLTQADVTQFRPTTHYALWHDRAVFHFLTDREDRRRYVGALCEALRPHGHVILATFGPDGPERCSGLPVVRYSAESLAAELGDDFRLVESSLEVHRTPWNSEQQFLYCRFVTGPARPARETQSPTER